MPCRIKVDEDLPADVAALCRAAGHDATTVVDQALTGTPDAAPWEVVQGENRWLFTADKGFADLFRRFPVAQGGLVLFRLPRESRQGYLRLASDLLGRVPLNTVHDAIVVVRPDAIRIYRLRRDGATDSNQ
ncbi:MAG: DUF5615 family PIN-like protein [Planctomycetes bacterium]|nr:DUF5615 family PIN-like protein [Planctomycetota bacterium]